ncbi:hypothetical protein [Gemmiger sp.]
MTRKKAIKIIMAVTGCGNRHWVGDVFAIAKRNLAGTPSNADVCYRVMCYLCNVGGGPIFFDTTTLRAHLIAAYLKSLYGDNVGGVLIGKAEGGDHATTD